MLEERDYYTMAHVLWVSASTRREAIRAQTKQADIGVRITVDWAKRETVRAKLRVMMKTMLRR